MKVKWNVLAMICILLVSVLFVDCGNSDTSKNSLNDNEEASKE